MALHYVTQQRPINDALRQTVVDDLPEIENIGNLALRRKVIEAWAFALSHSSFGASNSPSARKMRTALGMIRARAPELEIDGEMHADAALVDTIRNRAVADSKLTGTANLLIMPTLDAANIAFNLLKAAADGLPVGPLLLGMSKPIHVVVPSVTARGILNVSAVAAIQAQALRELK